MRPQLIFADERAPIAARLQQAFAGCQGLRALALTSAQLRQTAGVDALYLSLPYAERWGAQPLLYRAQILETGVSDNILPHYVIAGGALHPDQLPDARHELRQLIASVLDAVANFNRDSGQKIRTVGFATEMAGINRLSPEEAGQIIREMYEDKLQAAA